MLVLDIPRKCPPDFSYIEVPLYHRVHLALAANRALHACLLAGYSQPHRPELVISPFEFDSWDKLWRLNLTVKDRAGLFLEVCDIARHNSAQILAAESSTTQQPSLYQLEAVMELENEKAAEWIRLSVLTKLLKDMTFLQDGNPRLRLQRLQGLWHAKHAYETQRMKHQEFPPKKMEVQVRWAEDARPQMLHLVMPHEVQEVLKRTVRQDLTTHHDDGYYLRLSDTKNRFLRILYFRTGDPIIHARIEYNDRSDAAADITEALKASGFNILTAYLGPSGTRERSRLELVVMSDRLAAMPIDDRRAAFEEAISNSSGAQGLALEIGYPQNYAEDWNRKDVPASPASQTKSQPTSTKWFENLHRNLQTQHKELTTRAFAPSEVDRAKLVKRLIGKYEALTGKQSSKVLFISCHYTGAQLEKIKVKAKHKGFVVVTGEDLLRHKEINEGLVTRINSCTHFLGVWSREGARDAGKGHWPSPWLLWELGVASAFGLTWRLLISSSIDKEVWQRVAPHTPNGSFNEFDFESKLAQILDALAELPGGRSPLTDPIEAQNGYEV
ncbi:MAG TPA: hypothetical protein VFF39_17760 [Verrucomicrobiae bacterium]|nr:hypothetical protein [Verrucomicrobiae bacterium]